MSVELSPEALFFLLAGAVAGGFINGLAGFGVALFALGWWLQAFSAIEAVALSLAMSVASGLQGVALVRRSIQPRRLGVFLVPALLGIPIGYALLQHIDADLLKIVVGCFLLVYGGFFIARCDLPKIARPTPVIDGAIGFAGGVLGAVAGLSGALPTMWCAMRDWSKTESRAVLQPYNTTVLAIAMALLALNGVYDRDMLIAVVIALPATMLAAQLGIMIFKRLDDGQFRRLLIAMMFLSGVIVLGRELLSRG